MQKGLVGGVRGFWPTILLFLIGGILILWGAYWTPYLSESTNYLFLALSAIFLTIGIPTLLFIQALLIISVGDRSVKKLRSLEYLSWMFILLYAVDILSAKVFAESENSGQFAFSIATSVLLMIVYVISVYRERYLWHRFVFVVFAAVSILLFQIHRGWDFGVLLLFEQGFFTTHYYLIPIVFLCAHCLMRMREMIIR